MKKLVPLSICLLLLSGAIIAATDAELQAKAEVVHLLEFVELSTCQFNRNDTWYDGKDARSHLEMKYDALVLRGQIGKAENFIDKAASKSTFSGRDYQIRCQDGKTVSSAQWLTEELQRYRKDKNRQ